MAYLHVSFYGVRAAKVDLAVSVPQDHRLHEHTYAHTYIREWARVRDRVSVGVMARVRARVRVVVRIYPFFFLHFTCSIFFGD